MGSETSGRYKVRSLDINYKQDFPLHEVESQQQEEGKHEAVPKRVAETKLTCKEPIAHG